MRYDGYNGQIDIVGDALVITRTGLVAKLGSTGGSDRSIPLAAISGVKFKDATRLKNGYIQLGLGGREMRDLGAQAAASDPDTVIFTWNSRAQFDELHQWLRSVVEHNAHAQIDAATIDYDHGTSSREKTAERLVGPQGRPDVRQAVERLNWTLGGRREIRRLEEHLYDTETVQLIAQGTYERHQGIVVLTDTRLLFIFHGVLGQRKEDFPLRSINSVQTKAGIVTGELRIFSSGNTATISDIRKADLGPLADTLRQMMARGHHEQPAAAPVSDTAEQIRKLAELHEAGILTDDEFTAKKQDLLRRL
ncbi:hypothetical protein J2W56_004252 [Nocardia kruczakiae]|uniref:Oligomerization/nucleic acid binding protein n=1 Tax=Nocardia kruczakiae TaxID=261477 RepID=A0ABU1XKF8_9NOCA|nr:PH domain-containing protein [Nocardia kruczakiae]MDR7170501.1 hypothetical protein [Nocardia kruczakiae]